MEEYRVKSVIESLLLVSERPISLKDIEDAVGGAATREEIVAALERLRVDYESPERGMRLREAGGGWQLHTPPDNAEFVKEMLRLKPMRLSGAAMETLAIVAYRQPVTRPEVEEIRGVDCGGVLKILIDRRLVRILGKRNEVGRPFIYGTTKEFLEFFHLADLSHLPTLKDFEQLSRELGEQMGAEGGAAEGDAAAADGAGAPAQEPGDAAGAGEQAAAVGTMPQADEAPLDGQDELLDELTDAMTRLDSTRKSVVKTLGLKAAEGEAEAGADAEGGPIAGGAPAAAVAPDAAPHAVAEAAPAAEPAAAEHTTSTEPAAPAADDRRDPET
jgi:segregation and condensation protein B